MKVMGSGSGGVTGWRPLKEAVEVTLGLGLAVDAGCCLTAGIGLKVVVVCRTLGLLVVDGSSTISSSKSSIARLGLVRKSNEALILGEVVIVSGTAGVALKVVTLNWSPDTDPSFSCRSR